ncbi:aminotransferase class III-fold pyridoxal phosphate-dependent enzyme, partial [Virgibacillus sp. W0430]|uniref:aminotransferase class III-fold pyridoxal phosphate-dependent enzyme n=1 Tax=Virgibacillus sp. W0430 TaxID=3391580 RepID=UPI003F47748A
GGLFFPIPSKNANIDNENAYLIEQLTNYTNCRGLVLVHPRDSKKKISTYFNNKQIVGIKPYHIYSDETPTWKSSIRGFLPEWMWELANEYKSIIMLHMVKDEAILDTNNQQEIYELCTKYPHVRLVLAHCARSFHGPNAKGINALRGLENVWFDMSGICESEPIEHILSEFGPKKLLWGSDFPVSENRGKAVTFGNGFIWLQAETLKEKVALSHAQPLLVGIESLLALRRAVESFGLNDKDIKDIFFDNAAKLIGIKRVELNQTQKLYEHGKKLIPGGTQLLSKRPELMAPLKWPAYFSEARGCEVWDLDGRHYYDMSTNGIGSCLLGYRDEDVTRAVKRRLNLGSMSSLNPPEEIELAERLFELHPWANQARFTRSGGEVSTVAIRIARATTNRTVIAVCGYHGWHDWYLAANLGESDLLDGHLLPGLNPHGVPKELRNTTVTFTYNNKQELQNIFDEYGSDLAAVIMEPCRGSDPEDGFLEFVRDITKKNGTMLIFDEITVGFRLHKGGAHLKYNVIPDLAIFAKALGNGHPIAAVIGTSSTMEGAKDSFISSTYWTESIGPTAAIVTLKKMNEYSVPEHINKIGKMIENSWLYFSKVHEIPIKIGQAFPCFAKFEFDHIESKVLQTIYTQKMLERGFLAGLSIYPTMAHNDHIVKLYSEAIDEVFKELSAIVNNGESFNINKNEIAHSGFARLL